MTKKILDVPKVKQLKCHCGVASLEMVLAYNSINIDQKSLAQYFPNPDQIYKEGVWRSDIVKAAEEFGLSAEHYEHYSFDDVVSVIDEKVPIIARTKFYPRTRYRHFLVINGYDDQKGTIYVNDPYDLRRGKFEWKQFKNLWQIKGENSSKNSGVEIRQKKT
jgi:ABC-type bacteriocin/lantibiotic exporter with double-glycine peptidase domain